MTTFLATAKAGDLHFETEYNAIRFKEALKKHEGMMVRVELVEKGVKRTLTQNNFYWLYLSVIAAETGDTENDLHEFLKRKLLPPRFAKVMGQEIKLPASTTKLSKHDFGEYLERICALTEVPIPDPEKAGYITNY